MFVRALTQKCHTMNCNFINVDIFFENVWALQILYTKFGMFDFSQSFWTWRASEFRYRKVASLQSMQKLAIGMYDLFHQHNIIVPFLN